MVSVARSDVLVIMQLALPISWAVEPLSLISGRMGIKSECLVEHAHKTIGAWYLLCVWCGWRVGRTEFIRGSGNRSSHVL